MPGVNLYDALTTAVHRMPACCARTLADSLDVVNAEKRKPLRTEARDGKLVVSVDCPGCGKTTTIVIGSDGAVADVRTEAASSQAASSS